MFSARRREGPEARRREDAKGRRREGAKARRPGGAKTRRGGDAKGRRREGAGRREPAPKGESRARPVRLGRDGEAAPAYRETGRGGPAAEGRPEGRARW